MNRKHILMVALLMTIVSLMPCKAQMEELPPMGQFVLQGKMENVNPEKPGKVRLAVCDVWENELFEIPIQSDGTFMKALPIRDIQEVYLYMGNTIVLNVCAGDTITMTCDYKR